MLLAFSAQFTWIDWLVVIAYLAGATWLGAAMAGKQQTIRDFFLGGRKLPWYAVSGSIIATEISALTFVSVPFLVFKDGGNFTYLQLGVFGSFFARIVVGYWLVPAYYQREIYSPYDYMQHQLGGYVRPMITALFMLGSMLAQSARIYLTGEVLVVVLHDQLVWLTAQLGLDPLAWAIILITGVSLAWTLLGGMTTVIWTDVILFLAFVAGALVALGVIIANLDGGAAELVRTGLNAPNSGPHGKFTFFNFSTDFTHDLTIWAAVIASTWGGVGAYGIDQLLVQRMFCCKSPREARWAIISSAVSQLVTITVMLVGVGLYAYYQTHAMSSEGAAQFAVKGDRVLPIFTVEVVPMGLKGVIIAAVFAAAISTVMGVLTALAQTVQSAFYNPLRERTLRRRGIQIKLAESLEHDSPDAAAHAEHRRSVLVSRALIVMWALILSGLAYGARQAAEFYPTILQLGLAMAQYVIGALIAGFALAFFRLNIDGRGFLFSGPLSVLCIFALVWHQPWATAVCWVGGGALVVAWVLHMAAERERARISTPTCPKCEYDRRASPERCPECGSIEPPLMPLLAPLSLRPVAQSLILLSGVATMLCFNYFALFAGPPDTHDIKIAWPWLGPIGSVVAFAWGYWLARPRLASAVATANAS